jgi:phosphatidylethanolamine/phosphatidyl-N-methylethanolamine N-methyltransferase
MDKDAVTKIYDRWAPVYDLVFGAVFDRGRRAAIAASERVGGRILEVGIGTGISLPHYAPTSRIVGVDISEPMLRKARERVTKQRLTNVESLAMMDAQKMSFPDNAFEVVAAHCVVNTVPDPEAALTEFARVLKPGGEIIILSRVAAEMGMRHKLERIFTPVGNRLGWRPDFSWQRLQDWVDATPGIYVIENRPVPPLGHFSVIRFGKAPPRQTAVAAE